MNHRPPLQRAEKWLIALSLICMATAGFWWLMQRANPVAPFPRDAYEMGHAFSPDGKQVLMTWKSNFDDPPIINRARIVDADTLQTTCEIQPPSSDFWRPTGWTRDGHELVGVINDISNKNGQIAFWSAQTGNLLRTFPYAPSDEKSRAHVFFARDGLLVGDGSPPALFNPQSGERLRRYSTGFTSGNIETTLNERRNLIAVERSLSWPPRDFVVRDVEKNRQLWSLKEGTEPAWSGDILGVKEYKGNSKARLWLWDGNARRILPSPSSENVTDFNFSLSAPLVALVENRYGQNSKRLWSRLRVWDYRQGRVIWSLQPRTASVGAPAKWSPDGKRLAVKVGNALFVFDQKGKQIWDWRFPDYAYFEWAPDSRRIAVNNARNLRVLTIEPTESEFARKQ